MKPMEWNLHQFHEFSLDDSALISICKKGKVKDEASKKIRETNGGQIKVIDLRFPTGMMLKYFLTVFSSAILL